MSADPPDVSWSKPLAVSWDPSRLPGGDGTSMWERLRRHG